MRLKLDGEEAPWARGAGSLGEGGEGNEREAEEAVLAGWESPDEEARRLGIMTGGHDVRIPGVGKRFCAGGGVSRNGEEGKVFGDGVKGQRAQGAGWMDGEDHLGWG